MRLIDADTLHIDIIEKGQANERGKYIVGDIWELTGAEIREVIDSQPTINPEPHWIPVTERLPETELQHPGHGIGDYLKSDMVAVSGDFDYGDKVWIACYCDDLDGRTYWSDMDANTLYNVIAWMPLPEPYKGVTT